MPAGKIAKIRTVESWPADAGRRAARAPAARSASRSTASCSSSAATSSRMSARAPRDTRRLRARIFWLHDKPLRQGRPDPGPARHARKARATVVAIEKAVDPGELSSVERQGDRAQPCRRDRHLAGAADRRRSLHRQSAHRPPRDRGLRPHRRRRAGAVGRCRAARRARRHRAGGIRAAPRRALGALSPQRRGGLAHRPARRPANRRWRARWSGGCSAMAARRSCSTATRCAPASTAISASRPPTAARTSAASPKSRRISPATATSRSSPRSRPSREDRAAARRIADTAFREIYVATPAEICESRDPKGHYAKARAGALACVHRHRQRLPAARGQRA